MGAAEMLRAVWRVKDGRPAPEHTLGMLHSELGQARNLKSSCVASVLERLDDEVMASGFFEWAGLQKGFSHSIHTWNMLMKAYVNAGRHREVRALIRDKSKALFEPDEETYHIVIRGYMRAGKTEQAFGILDEMESRGLATPRKTHSSILFGLCKEGKVSTAIKHLENMEKFGMVTTLSYNILISSLCKLGLVEEAMGLASELPSKGCSPDVVTYSSIVVGLCLQGRLDEALQLFGDLVRDGSVPRREAFEALRKSLGEAGREGERVQVLRHAANCGVENSKLGEETTNLIT